MRLEGMANTKQGTMDLWVFGLGLLLFCFSCLGVQKEKTAIVPINGNTLTLKVMAFNIWQEGTMVENGLDKIREVILETGPDIIGFTEVRNYNDNDWTSRIVEALKAKGHEYFGLYAGGDVSLLSKYPILSSQVITDKAGSIIRFNVQLEHRTVVVAVAHLDYTGYACYLPRGYYGGAPDWGPILDQQGNKMPITDVDKILAYNSESARSNQIEAFLEAVKNETQPVLIIGDFNEPSHLDWTVKTADRFDHNGVIINWPSTYALFQNGFIDAYRDYFPDELQNPGITWPSYAHGKASTSWTPLSDERDRIDYIFYKGQGIKTTYASLVGPELSYVFGIAESSNTSNENFMASTLGWPSDHKAVMVTLRFWN